MHGNKPASLSICNRGFILVFWSNNENQKKFHKNLCASCISKKLLGKEASYCTLLTYCICGYSCFKFFGILNTLNFSIWSEFYPHSCHIGISIRRTEKFLSNFLCSFSSCTTNCVINHRIIVLARVIPLRLLSRDGGGGGGWEKGFAHNSEIIFFKEERRWDA